LPRSAVLPFSLVPSYFGLFQYIPLRSRLRCLDFTVPTFVCARFILDLRTRTVRDFTLPPVCLAAPLDTAARAPSLVSFTSFALRHKGHVWFRAHTPAFYLFRHARTRRFCHVYLRSDAGSSHVCRSLRVTLLPVTLLRTFCVSYHRLFPFCHCRSLRFTHAWTRTWVFTFRWFLALRFPFIISSPRAFSIFASFVPALTTFMHSAGLYHSLPLLRIARRCCHRARSHNALCLRSFSSAFCLASFASSRIHAPRRTTFSRPLCCFHHGCAFHPPPHSPLRAALLPFTHVRTHCASAVRLAFRVCILPHFLAQSSNS